MESRQSILRHSQIRYFHRDGKFDDLKNDVGPEDGVGWETGSDVEKISFDPADYRSRFNATTGGGAFITSEFEQL